MKSTQPNYYSYACKQTSMKKQTGQDGTQSHYAPTYLVPFCPRSQGRIRGGRCWGIFPGSHAIRGPTSPNAKKNGMIIESKWNKKCSMLWNIIFRHVVSVGTGGAWAPRIKLVAPFPYFMFNCAPLQYENRLIRNIKCSTSYSVFCLLLAR